jgi:hypothetical protein
MAVRYALAALITVALGLGTGCGQDSGRSNRGAQPSSAPQRTLPTIPADGTLNVSPKGGEPLVTAMVREDVTERRLLNFMRSPVVLARLTLLGVDTIQGPSDTDRQIALLYPTRPTLEELEQARDVLMRTGLFSATRLHPDAICPGGTTSSSISRSDGVTWNKTTVVCPKS